MNYKPMLFNTEMVKAILNGKKTQTRREIKNEQILSTISIIKEGAENLCDYKKGDVIWVRETFYKTTAPELKGEFYYKASIDSGWKFRWKPSIHMPKEACRLFLEVSNVKIERLQDISENDAISEGVTPYAYGYWKNYISLFSGGRPKTGIDFKDPKDSFKTLWASIYGVENLKQNPYVFVIEFKRIDKPKSFNNQ